MPAVPLLTQLLPHLAGQSLVGVQDDARLGVVLVERRGVLLERPGQANGVLADIGGHLAMYAVERQPPHVHDLVVPVDRLPAAHRVTIEVRQPVVTFLLHFHEPGMQRVQLLEEATSPTHFELVGVAVEPKMQAQLLHPLVPGLP